MSAHEWKVVVAFGALAGALALFDGKLALQMIGVAAFVVVVRNSNKLPITGGGKVTA
jgi:hypothetical protein